jgi:poly-beta-1,6-N-acetyl-D-glucosamine synthase
MYVVFVTVSVLSAVTILLFVASFLLIWQFTGYPLLMGLIALLRKPKDKDYGFQPFISIVVPTYDEEPTIEKRIHNLYSLDYPTQNYEVIIVDSGSADDTTGVVERIIEKCKGEGRPRLSLVKEEQRNGKATAINTGKRRARGDVVLVTDANCVFDHDVLKEIAPHFKNPAIGAVGGKYTVMNPGSSLTSSAQFYWDLEQILRTGEAALDSACLFHGELNAWRKDLMDLDPTMLSEDLDMCINLRKMGYKIEYEPKAIVYEAAPTTVEEQIRQRKRTSIGTIKSLVKNLDYELRPKDLYRSLILPSHKSLVMLSPFILLAIPLLYVMGMDLHTVLLHLIITGVVFAVTFGLLMHVRALVIADDKKNTRFSMSAALKMIYYVLLNEYIVLIAWKDFLSHNYSVLWDKVETTRQMSATER